MVRLAARSPPWASMSSADSVMASMKAWSVSWLVRSSRSMRRCSSRSACRQAVSRATSTAKGRAGGLSRSGRANDNPASASASAAALTGQEGWRLAGSPDCWLMETNYQPPEQGRKGPCPAQGGQGDDDLDTPSFSQRCRSRHAPSFTALLPARHRGRPRTASAWAASFPGSRARWHGRPGRRGSPRRSAPA